MHAACKNFCWAMKLAISASIACPTGAQCLMSSTTSTDVYRNNTLLRATWNLSWLLMAQPNCLFIGRCGDESQFLLDGDT